MWFSFPARQDSAILQVKRHWWSLAGILQANFMAEYIGCVCMLHHMASLTYWRGETLMNPQLWSPHTSSPCLSRVVSYSGVIAEIPSWGRIVWTGWRVCKLCHWPVGGSEGREKMSHQPRSSFITRWPIVFPIQDPRYACPTHHPPTSVTTVHHSCSTHYPPTSFATVYSPPHYLPACLTNLIIQRYSFMFVTSHYHIHHYPGTSFTIRKPTCYSPRPS